MRRCRPGPLLLVPLLLLPACRTWHRFPEIPPLDMTAAVRAFMGERHPRRAVERRPRWNELEVGFSETDWFLVVAFIFLTCGIVLPIVDDYEVAVRPDGAGGSELSVDVARRWLLFYFVPVRAHDEVLEAEARQAILEHATGRRAAPGPRSMTPAHDGRSPGSGR